MNSRYDLTVIPYITGLKSELKQINSTAIQSIQAYTCVDTFIRLINESNIVGVHQQIVLVRISSQTVYVSLDFCCRRC